jgi:lipopolysaccharide transport system ATP-binding protein
MIESDDIVISVEGLGKRYSIRHERERYTALRDVLADKAKGLFRRNGGSQPSTLNSQPSKEDFWALKDVSFEVKRGEVLGIIGRNGAGKTTLLKILSRITEPTEGRVRIKGRVASLLEVGTGFHPELTGRENIYLNGAILGMSKAEIKKKFDEIVAFAETEKFLDTPVKRYSSGMYVRLAFAVAAHLEPEILVVDEVLAVGDAEFQKKCLGKMESVAKREGRTVLFVSHNMAAVHRLCDSAILLHEGNLSDIGSVKDVIEHYLTSFTGTSDGEAIEPRQHVVNTGEVWIDRVTLTRETGEPASDIQLAEPLNILIRFEVRLPVRQLRFGIGLNTPDGVRVATLHHTDDEHEPISLAPGFYEMSLSITNPLSPGAYIISVGAHRALGGQTVEYIPEALRFNVLDVGQDRLVHHNYNAGLVRVAARWQVPDRV